MLQLPQGLGTPRRLPPAHRAAVVLGGQLDDHADPPGQVQHAQGPGWQAGRQLRARPAAVPHVRETVQQLGSVPTQAGVGDVEATDPAGRRHQHLAQLPFDVAQSRGRLRRQVGVVDPPRHQVPGLERRPEPLDDRHQRERRSADGEQALADRDRLGVHLSRAGQPRQVAGDRQDEPETRGPGRPKRVEQARQVVARPHQRVVGEDQRVGLVVPLHRPDCIADVGDPPQGRGAPRAQQGRARQAGRSRHRSRLRPAGSAGGRTRQQ
jgi:hypothetical protein